VYHEQQGRSDGAQERFPVLNRLYVRLDRIADQAPVVDVLARQAEMTGGR
jgi:hypothetical protein